MNDARPMHVARAVALGLLALTALPATVLAASTCYTVYDRRGEIVYRENVAPFEGWFDPDSTGRQGMRSRGEHLVFFDAEHCPPVVTRVGGPGGRPLTTDEIVASFPTGVTYGDPRMATGFAVSVPSPAAPATGGPAARITAPATNAVQMRTGSYR